MISHAHQCIFVHIPKVAGTSIIDVFSNDAQPESLSVDFRQHAFIPPPPHLPALHYLKYGLVTQQQFDDYFKFSFVRNPWDRLVSEYKYRRHPQNYCFKDFLFKHFPSPAWNDEYCHVIPQYDFLFDDQGHQMVNFIGRYEHLADDFHHVCEVLSISQSNLPHKNRSNSFMRRDNDLIEVLRTLRSKLSLNQKRFNFKHYTQYYDDESVEFVRNLYHKDVETFQYQFGN